MDSNWNESVEEEAFEEAGGRQQPLQHCEPSSRMHHRRNNTADSRISTTADDDSSSSSSSSKARRTVDSQGSEEEKFAEVARSAVGSFRCDGVLSTSQRSTRSEKSKELAFAGTSGPPARLPGAVAVSNYGKRSSSCNVDSKSDGNKKDKKKRRRAPKDRSNLELHTNSRRTKKSQNVGGDDISLASLEDNDETALAAATTPPVFRSIADMLPLAMANNGNLPSNVVLVAGDDSVTTNQNSAGVGGNVRTATTSSIFSGSVVTSSSMQTAQAANHHHRQQQQETAPSHHQPDNYDDPTILVVAPANGEGRWCNTCGNAKTHEKERYGPFGLLSRMTPLTEEGRVYKGYCLCYYDVYELRQLLNDPNIPLDLIRHDTTTTTSSNARRSSRLLQQVQQDGPQQEGLFTETKRHRSPIQVLCASFHFQMLCGIIMIVIVGACIGVGVVLSESPEPWVSPPPTTVPTVAPTTQYPSSAPTSFEDNLLMTIAKDDIESFGYHVELSHDGTIMAVTSPKYDGNSGRLDIFRIGSTNWQSIGDDAIVGDLQGDQLGISVSLSGDGKSVAVGLPGNSAGRVKVYTIDHSTGLLSQKGQSITGPAPLSQFGYSVKLNTLGSRLFVGAPKFASSPIEIYGLVQVYDYDGVAWVQVGADIIGETAGSRFGHTVSSDHTGERLVVGSPSDDYAGEDAGRISLYHFDNDDWAEVDTALLYGSKAGSRLGETLSLDCLGLLISSGNHDESSENFDNAGMLTTWTLYPDIEKPPSVFSDPISGTYDGAHFGQQDVKIDCTRIEYAVAIASSANGNGRAGSTRLEVLDPIYRFENGSFGPELFGPELGDVAWLGTGPSVAITGPGNRVAIGYENVRYNDESRSEVRIYSYHGFKGI